MASSVGVAGFTGVGRRGGRGWCRPDSDVWDIWAGLVGVLVTEAYDVFAGGGGWGGGVRAVGVVMSWVVDGGSLGGGVVGCLGLGSGVVGSGWLRGGVVGHRGLGSCGFIGAGGVGGSGWTCGSWRMVVGVAECGSYRLRYRRFLVVKRPEPSVRTA